MIVMIAMKRDGVREKRKEQQHTNTKTNNNTTKKEKHKHTNQRFSWVHDATGGRHNGRTEPS
jgi:hypothetical protein